MHGKVTEGVAGKNINEVKKKVNLWVGTQEEVEDI